MQPTHNIQNQAGSNGARALLEAKLAELTGGFEDRSGLLIENSADVIDIIRMAMDRDLVVLRMNATARLLADVREALAALDNGTYGWCEDCEQSIPARRLAAIPWARVCVHCQEARDRRMAEDAAKEESFPLAA